MKRNRKSAAALLLALLLTLAAPMQALAIPDPPEAPPENEGIFQNGSLSGPQTIPGQPALPEPEEAPLPDGAPPPPEAPAPSGIFQNGDFDAPQTIPGDAVPLAASGWESLLYDAVLQGWRDLKEYVDISSLGLYAADNEAIWDVLRTIVNDNGELFYANWYGVDWKNWTQETGWQAAGIKLQYRGDFTPATAAPAVREFNAAVDRCLALVDGVTDPVEKALILHDAIVTGCAYTWGVATDQREGDAYIESGIPWTSYGVLVKGDGVCQGYTLAYKYLLKRVGIDSIYVSSKSMNHAWNIVYINGNTYHVDCTWDDPTPNKEGKCRHFYFLLSDATMGDSAHSHKDWVPNTIPCTSTDFESGWVFTGSSRLSFPFYRWNGWFYHIQLTNNDSACALYRTTDLRQTGEFLADLGSLAGGAVWVDDRVYLFPESGWANEQAKEFPLLVYDLDDRFLAQAGSFVHTPTASPDGAYALSRDNSPGIRYNAADNAIEAVSGTRRSVVYRVPAVRLYSGWKDLAAPASSVAIAPGLLTNGAAALVWNTRLTPPSGNLTLWAAFFRDGRLTDVQAVPVQPRTNISRLSLTEQITLVYLDMENAPDGDGVRMMLLGPDFVPAAAAR